MSDETGISTICPAAGDPCIPEIPKPLCTNGKTENSEIAFDAEIIAPAVITASQDEKILSATPSSDSNTNTPASIEKLETVTSINGKDDPRITTLQQDLEVQKRTSERDAFEKKLLETEKKLSELEKSFEAATSGSGQTEIDLRRELKDLKENLTQSQAKLNDRGRLMTNQENQIGALTKQVSSLKEVVAITKNLLEIRNMEVKHLQDDVDGMESRITAERERHNAMLRKMEAAVRLNADLKTEYETQLRLFQDLRGKYEEKVTLLTNEKNSANPPVEEKPPSALPSVQ